MNLSLNDAAGVLFLVFAVAALGLSLHIARGKRRERVAEQEWDTALLMAGPATPWNGTEWPPNVDQYLDDPRAYYEQVPTQPFQVIPDSTISGPLPVQRPRQVRYANTGPQQRPPMSIDEYMARQQAETEAWMASMRAHTDGWVAYYASGTEMVR